MVRPKEREGTKMARPKDKVPGGVAVTQRGAFLKKTATEEQRLKELLAQELRGHMVQMLDDELLTDFTVSSKGMEKQTHRAVFQARYHTPEDAAKFDKFLQEDKLTLPQTSRFEFDSFLRSVYSEDRAPCLWNYFASESEKKSCQHLPTPGMADVVSENGADVPASDETGAAGKDTSVMSMTEQAEAPFRGETEPNQPRNHSKGSQELALSKPKPGSVEREKDGGGNGSSATPSGLLMENDFVPARPAVSSDQQSINRGADKQSGSIAEENCESVFKEQDSDNEKDFSEKVSDAEKDFKEKVSDNEKDFSEKVSDAEKDFKEKVSDNEKDFSEKVLNGMEVFKEEVSDMNANAESENIYLSLIHRMEESPPALTCDSLAADCIPQSGRDDLPSPSADEVEKTLDANQETISPHGQNNHVDDKESTQNVSTPGSENEGTRSSGPDAPGATAQHRDDDDGEIVQTNAAKLSPENVESREKSSENRCESDASSLTLQASCAGDISSNRSVELAAERGKLANVITAVVSGGNEEVTAGADCDQGGSPHDSEDGKARSLEDDSRRSKDQEKEREDTADDNLSSGNPDHPASNCAEILEDSDQNAAKSADLPNFLPANNTDKRQNSVKELAEEDGCLLTGALDPTSDASANEGCHGNERVDGAEETNGGPDMASVIKLSYELTLPHRACSPLGEDLLRLWLQERSPDCELVACGQRFHAHRCILAARSSYFAAMFAGQWRESWCEEVVLEGPSPMALEQALLYLYGGVWELTKECSLADLLHLADMYGMLGLKSAVEFHLRRDFCHFFHKPCAECTTRVCNALYLAVLYDMEAVRAGCLEWMAHHFTKVWATRAFAALPDNILQMACDAIIKSLRHGTVVEVILACHKLNSSIPHIKWAEPVLLLATSLLDQCLHFVTQNFVRVIRSHPFLSLAQSAAWSGDILEESLGMVIDSLMPGAAVEAYRALLQLLPSGDREEEDPSNQDFLKVVKALISRCRTYMRLYISHVTRTEEWTLLPAPIRDEILQGSAYVCVEPRGRGRAMPPQLSSSRRTGGKARTSSLLIETMRSDQQYADARDRANGHSRSSGARGSSASKSLTSLTQDAGRLAQASHSASSHRHPARKEQPRSRQTKTPSQLGASTLGTEQRPRGRAPRDDKPAESDAAAKLTFSLPKGVAPLWGASPAAGAWSPLGAWLQQKEQTAAPSSAATKQPEGADNPVGNGEEVSGAMGSSPEQPPSSHEILGCEAQADIVTRGEGPDSGRDFPVACSGETLHLQEHVMAADEDGSAPEGDLLGAEDGCAGMDEDQASSNTAQSLPEPLRADPQEKQFELEQRSPVFPPPGEEIPGEGDTQRSAFQETQAEFEDGKGIVLPNLAPEGTSAKPGQSSHSEALASKGDPTQRSQVVRRRPGSFSSQHASSATKTGAKGVGTTKPRPASVHGIISAKSPATPASSSASAAAVSKRGVPTGDKGGVKRRPASACLEGATAEAISKSSSMKPHPASLHRPSSSSKATVPKQSPAANGGGAVKKRPASACLEGAAAEPGARGSSPRPRLTPSLGGSSSAAGGAGAASRLSGPARVDKKDLKKRPASACLEGTPADPGSSRSLQKSRPASAIITSSATGPAAVGSRGPSASPRDGQQTKKRPASACLEKSPADAKSNRSSPRPRPLSINGASASATATSSKPSGRAPANGAKSEKPTADSNSSASKSLSSATKLSAPASTAKTKKLESAAGNLPVNAPQRSKVEKPRTSQNASAARSSPEGAASGTGPGRAAKSSSTSQASKTPQKYQSSTGTQTRARPPSAEQSRFSSKKVPMSKADGKETTSSPRLPPAAASSTSLSASKIAKFSGKISASGGRDVKTQASTKSKALPGNQKPKAEERKRGGNSDSHGGSPPSQIPSRNGEAQSAATAAVKSLPESESPTGVPKSEAAMQSPPQEELQEMSKRNNLSKTDGRSADRECDDSSTQVPTSTLLLVPAGTAEVDSVLVVQNCSLDLILAPDLKDGGQEPTDGEAACPNKDNADFGDEAYEYLHFQTSEMHEIHSRCQENLENNTDPSCMSAGNPDYRIDEYNNNSTASTAINNNNNNNTIDMHSSQTARPQQAEEAAAGNTSRQESVVLDTAGVDASAARMLSDEDTAAEDGGI